MQGCTSNYLNLSFKEGISNGDVMKDLFLK